MDKSFKQNNNDLEWGNLFAENLLRKLYSDKDFRSMSEQEINQMLEDLI